MKYDDTYLQGLGTYLPEGRESSTKARRAGRFSQEDFEKTCQKYASVGGSSETSPNMAIWAAERAFSDSGNKDPDDVGFFAHAVAFHTGLEAWSGGAYIGKNLQIPGVLPLEIRATCAGSIVGIEIAAKLNSLGQRALVTAADIWRLPVFDRWNTDAGLVYGDGAAAAIVSSSPGNFKLLSTAVRQNSNFEQMHRGNASLDLPVYREPLPLRMRDRSADYAREFGLAEFWEANTEGLSAAVDTALFDAGIPRSAIARWSVPHFGKSLLQKQCLNPIGLELDETTAHFGFQIGHTGASDPLLGLNHLRDTASLERDDFVALIGIGAGFTWAVAIVQYLGTES